MEPKTDEDVKKVLLSKCLGYADEMARRIYSGRTKTFKERTELISLSRKYKAVQWGFNKLH